MNMCLFLSRHSLVSTHYSKNKVKKKLKHLKHIIFSSSVNTDEKRQNKSKKTLNGRAGVKWDLRIYCASLVVQTAKNPPAMHKTQIWSLGQEDPLEKGMATHSSILWRTKWQNTPVSLPWEFHGQRRLVGCNPRGRKELDMTEWITRQYSCLENSLDRAAWRLQSIVIKSRTQLNG